MNEKQFPQLPKELIKSDIGILVFEHEILESSEEMCQHDLRDLLFLAGASDAIKVPYIFFDFDLTFRNQ